MRVFLWIASIAVGAAGGYWVGAQREAVLPARTPRQSPEWRTPSPRTSGAVAGPERAEELDAQSATAPTRVDDHIAGQRLEQTGQGLEQRRREMQIAAQRGIDELKTTYPVPRSDFMNWVIRMREARRQRILAAKTHADLDNVGAD